MKIAIIHSGNSGFFPRFYRLLCNAIEENKDKCILLVPNSGRNKRCVLPNQITWGTRFNWYIHSICYKITGLQDIFSIFDTFHLIYILKQQKPDVIHLNVINDKIINMPLLVRYINTNNIAVVWTMHDCRAFTGQCPYFDEVNCFRWKTGCGQCPICETKIDNTNITWNLRKKWQTRIKRMVIVTPSQWLANYVKESFFKNYPIKVIYNGVNIDGIFKNTELDVRKEYNISENKKIILGCSIFWEYRKGLNFFIQLAKKLNSDYQIVLIGNIDDEKKKELIDNNIICTGKTNTFDEMVAWYQAASVFCNPTMADNFPTVNIESLAVGTPVVTFNTGGSPEAIDENTGIVVEQGNVEELYNALIYVTENMDAFSYENCIKRFQLFSIRQYKIYVNLYHKVCEKIWKEDI